MQKKIYLRWDDDNFAVDNFEVYRDVAPMDLENLPPPIAIVDANKRYYEDSDVVEGNEYYYRIGAVLGADKRISSEIVASTLVGDPYWDNVVSLMHFDGNLNDETGATWGSIPSGWNFGESTFDGQRLNRPSGTSGSIASDINADFSVGEDFTIEFQYTVPSVFNRYDWVLGTQRYSGTIKGWRIDYYNVTNSVEFVSSTGAILQGITPPNFTKLFCVERHNGILRMYFDGVVVDTQEFNGAIVGTENLTIGDAANHTSAREGFSMDELRVTRGVARYQGDYTPSTVPFPNFKPSVAPDPHWDKVVSLLHFDEVPLSTDAKGKLWTITNPTNVELSTDVQKFGSAAKFGRSGYGYLRAGASSEHDLGAEDFTIEFWMYKPAPITETAGLVDFRPIGGATANAPCLFLYTGGKVTYIDGGSQLIQTDPISANTWIHIALCRLGNLITMYENGLAVGTTTKNNSFSTNLPITIGRVGDTLTSNAHYLKGYLDELRITKGVARYTENFIPPTEPFPNF